MSVSTTTTTIDYTGDGVTDEFIIPFPYLDKAHVYVKVGADVNNLGEQAQGIAFTIDLDGPQDANAANVTMTTPPSTGYVVRVYRVVPLTQATDLRAQGNFSAATHENALDKLTMIAQQLNAGALVAETIVTGAQLDSATTPTAVTAATGTPGVSTSASPADHRHQVTTAAASSLTPDGANSAGVSNSLARADHHHLLATYSSTPAAIGTASAGTSGTAPARGNHVHAHGNQLGGSLHADVTTTTDGFMTAIDKTKLDSIEKPFSEFFDDFTYGTETSLWDVNHTGSGSTSVNTSFPFGVHNLTTGAVANNNSEMVSGLLSTSLQDALFEARVGFDSVTNCVIRIGMKSTSGEYAYAELDTAASPNWTYKTYDGATLRTSSSGVAASTSMSTFYILISSGEAVFKIDGAASATVVAFESNWPLYCYLYVETKGAVARTLSVDLVRVRWPDSAREAFLYLTTTNPWT